jgi:large subunit ribosomal protein L15
MARSGHNRKPGFEGGQMRLIRRMPKRGFKNPVRRAFAALNVAALENFADGTEVTADLLASSGLVKKAPQGVKILGDGTLTRKLVVKAHAFSASARAKIEAVGGRCEVAKD